MPVSNADQPAVTAVASAVVSRMTTVWRPRRGRPMYRYCVARRVERCPHGSLDIGSFQLRTRTSRRATTQPTGKIRAVSWPGAHHPEVAALFQARAAS